MALMDDPKNKEQMDRINKDGGDLLEPKVHNVKSEADVGQMHEHFGASWRYRNLLMEAENAFEHYHYFKLHEREKSVIADTSRAPQPAIILGSGCSMDEVMPYLAKWKGGIFCSTSHLSTLAHAGINPTCFACPDPRGDMSEFAMPGDKLQDMFKHTMMACTPIQPHQYTTFWEGRRRWFLIFDPTKEWYAQILRPVFSWISDVLLPFSASVPALVAIAQYLNYAPLYLLGCDFAGNRFNAWNWQQVVKDTGEKTEVGPQPETYEWKENKGGLYPPSHQATTYHGKISAPNLMWAWRGLLCVARINTEMRHGKKWHMYNCGGDKSALDGIFPPANPWWLVNTQGRGMIMTWSRTRFINELDIALARFNTVVFGIHNGIDYGTRVQIANSYEDLEAQLKALNEQLHASAQVWTKLSPEQQAEIHKQSKFDPDKVRGVDVPAFMEKFRGLKAEAKKRDGK